MANIIRVDKRQLCNIIYKGIMYVTSGTKETCCYADVIKQSKRKLNGNSARKEITLIDRVRDPI